MFLIKPVKCDKYQKKKFSQQSEPHSSAKPMPFCCFWNIFGKIHRELFFLYIKVTISEKSTEIVRIFFFLPILKGSNPE